MVYKVKTPSKNQQQQFKKGKKAVQVKQEEEDNDFDMDDSDDAADSDEAPQLQKTPVNKGNKGRQSMSEKKVSFSIPGKNSPAVKTPKKENSILSKKQPTPASKGKTSMQEFKGMKGKQVQKEDDDDDDEEDDDFEIDEDSDDLDLDIDEGDDAEGGEEDDDDDDDDDEDDDDDDEDEEDNQGTIQKKLLLLKQNNVQQNKQKTPVKGSEKAKNVESPAKVQTPKKEQAEKPKNAKYSQQITDEVERRRQRDAKMLYIGGLPNDVTEQELKSLSSDIQEVTLPLGNRKNPSKTVFAFFSFNTEAKAESNYKTLQSKKFRGQPLSLDFVGFKSKNKKASDETNLKFNLKKLFVAGIPVDATIDQVAKFFKGAFQITFNRSPLFRTAVISFENEEAAKEAHDSNKEIVLSGHKLPVLYSRQAGQTDSRKRKNRNRKAHKNNQNQGENPAKKMKFSKPE